MTQIIRKEAALARHLLAFSDFFFFLLAHALSKHLLKVFPVLRQESMWSGPAPSLLDAQLGIQQPCLSPEADKFLN